MDCIIREILDAFWSRSEGTVRGYLRKALQMIEFFNTVGLKGPFKFRKLLLWYDHYGYKVAVEMLLYSRCPGKHAEYMQFDTIRSFRTVYGNFVRASPDANIVPLSLGDPTGCYQRLGTNPCGSLLF